MKQITVFTHKHPSGGFCVDFPTNIHVDDFDVLKKMAVWSNSPMFKGYTELEFLTEDFLNDIKFFELFIDQYFTLLKYNVEMNPKDGLPTMIE